MNFKELLLAAKHGDSQAVCSVLELYKPLLLKESIVNGVFDEDLYQELCMRGWFRSPEILMIGKFIFRLLILAFRGRTFLIIEDSAPLFDFCNFLLP